jgi:flagellar motor switch protein FliN
MINPEHNMEALMDVQLQITVSFGRSRVALRDILDSEPGSLIPLERTEGQLVEIQVNRSVIGYGEVVDVDGHYGIRIHHLAKSPLTKSI